MDLNDYGLVALPLSRPDGGPVGIQLQVPCLDCQRLGADLNQHVDLVRLQVLRELLCRILLRALLGLGVLALGPAGARDECRGMVGSHGGSTRCCPAVRTLSPRG